MANERLAFSGHAIRRMFERAISVDDVRTVIDAGEEIARYPDDRPFPSQLLLGWVVGRPLHVVFALDSHTATGYVVTVYEPDVEQWTPDFRVRRAR